MTIQPAYRNATPHLDGPVYDHTSGSVYCTARCAADDGADLRALVETTPQPGDVCGHCQCVVACNV